MVLFGVIVTFEFKSMVKPNSHNAFDRRFIHSKMIIKDVVGFPDKQVSFAGKLDTDIKLNIHATQFTLFKLDYSLNNLDTLIIKFPSLFNKKVTIFKDLLGSNIYYSNSIGDFFIFDGNTSVSYKVKGVSIDKFQAISPNTIIARALHNFDKQSNRSLVKLKISNKVVTENEYILPKNINGFFTNDGFLNYDKQNALILYLYSYRGEFLCLDTNLRLLYKAKTIDTVRTAQIKTGFLTSRGKNGELRTLITPTSPPNLINVCMTTNRDKIYIRSKLKADNESDTNFEQNNVVDVYDIKQGGYLYSFYIPKYKHNRIREFQINGKNLVAIYKDYLVTYSFVE